MWMESASSRMRLQWGRRLLSTETRCAACSSRVRLCASMGPSTAVDGDSVRAAEVVIPHTASMGPSTAVDGDVKDVGDAYGYTMLQWGRRLLSTETLIELRTRNVDIML